MYVLFLIISILGVVFCFCALFFTVFNWINFGMDTITKQWLASFLIVLLMTIPCLFLSVNAPDINFVLIKDGQVIDKIKVKYFTARGYIYQIFLQRQGYLIIPEKELK